MKDNNFYPYCPDDDQDEKNPLTWGEWIGFMLILAISFFILAGSIWFGVIHFYRVFQ